MESARSSKVNQERVLQYLQEGKLHLEKNAPQQALAVLQQAHELVPDNVAVQTLLALSHFKLGNLGAAEMIYKALIQENPDEASLRSHLAMQYIQQERFEDARSLLEEAISLQPNYTTAHSSLGLVYAKLERYAEAKEQFLHAGQSEMAKKMEEKLELLRQEEESAQDDDVEIEPPPEFSIPDLDDAHELDTPASSHDFDLSSLEEDFGGELDLDLEPPPVEIEESSTTEGSERPEDALPVVVLPPSGKEATVQVPDEDVPFTTRSQKSNGLTPPAAAPTNVRNIWLPDEQTLDKEKTFHLFDDGRLLVNIKRRAYLRLQDLLSISGSPDIQWESKRFQGKSIEQPFGPIENPVARIEGNSQILLHATKDRYRTQIDINSAQAAYFGEGEVLGFSGEISWENGRIPSPIDGIPDLPLDNFWGDGSLVLKSKAKIWGLKIRADKRVRVAYHHLIGWLGSLVPSIIIEEDLTDRQGKPKAFIEFEGEGGIFVTG